MRRSLIGAIAALAVAAGSAHAASAPIGHAGRWITDAGGRVLVVHGVNLVYKRPPYAPDAIGFDEPDAAFLQQQGFNAVRLGLIWKAIEPQPGVYDDAYLARIRRTVALLRAHGIVTQLDFHQDQLNERFYGEGFPDWAIQDDGLPNKPDFGFGPNYLLLSSLQRALDHFWANSPGPGGVGLQDRYDAAWGHVARYFRNDSDLLGYDLFNEPFPGTNWQTCVLLNGCPAFDAKLTTFNAHAIAAIRAAGGTSLAWYEPNVIFNNGPDTHVDSGGDTHSGFSFHDYCLIEPQTGSDAGCGVFDDLVFSNAAKHAQQTGDALLLSEFGATDDAANNRAMVERSDRNMVSWVWWHYCACEDPTTSGPGTAQALVSDPRKPPEGDNLQPGKLDVVVRPYPQLVAGTPRSWSFDAATHVFAARYVTARADGGGVFAEHARSVFFIPARQYPAGYSVQVDGAAVTSAPGAQLLELSACSGATVVTLTVAPSGRSTQTCAETAPTPALRLSLAPRRVHAGRLTRVRLTVRGPSGVVPGAHVRFAGLTHKTGADGKAAFRLRLRKRGLRAVVATAPGYAAARAHLRVVR
jgi:endoglycosylceramidase